MRAYPEQEPTSPSTQGLGGSSTTALVSISLCWVLPHWSCALSPVHCMPVAASSTAKMKREPVLTRNHKCYD